MQRNYSIDVLKFVCAVMVVFLHTSFRYQDYVRPLLRCAVPCFFMVSGYLLYNKDNIGKPRLKRNAVRVLKIILWSTLLFAVFKEFAELVLHKQLYVPSVNQLFDFIFFNENPFAFHLWYLGAYLYVLIIVYFVDKFDKWKYLFALIPVLLLGDLLLGKYSLVTLGKEFPVVYVRNFLFVGLPYFAIGAWLKARESQLFSINKYLLWGGVMVFTLTSFLEREILYELGKSSLREHYISTTFCSICLFLLFISYSVKKTNFFSIIGEKDSLYIYVLHPLFSLYFFPFINEFMPIVYVKIYSYVAPILVLLCTMLLIQMLRLCKLIK